MMVLIHMRPRNHRRTIAFNTNGALTFQKFDRMKNLKHLLNVCLIWYAFTPPQQERVKVLGFCRSGHSWLGS